ncbi:MAG: preprotein translocase subunit SecG [Candidatus Shapirobacteria bacterium]|nr:preprotein translocase subunit SecG [Candidatus Shapirobacteria bacterium]MDD5073951.1 preprotein translocase subunit SecG [Candidatus Shapirobacteria bacterium]MDD5481879.1 preprotein translocase subunit SecG [Candidatus Shapirobacteria bacterium]
MITILNIIQIIVSLLLVIIVLLTVRGGGFSQGSLNAPPSKTGTEKTIFYSLIVLAIIFAVLSVTRLYFF